MKATQILAAAEVKVPAMPRCARDHIRNVLKNRTQDRLSAHLVWFVLSAREPTQLLPEIGLQGK